MRSCCAIRAAAVVGSVHRCAQRVDGAITASVLRLLLLQSVAANGAAGTMSISLPSVAGGGGAGGSIVLMFGSISGPLSASIQADGGDGGGVGGACTPPITTRCSTAHHSTARAPNMAGANACVSTLSSTNVLGCRWWWWRRHCDIAAHRQQHAIAGLSGICIRRRGCGCPVRERVTRRRSGERWHGRSVLQLAAMSTW